MEFIEVPAFTSRVRRYLGETRYADLQDHLCLHPTAGALMPGSKGLGKVRWAAKGQGKRGGVRVIYYWHALLKSSLFSISIRKTKKTT